MLEKVRKDKKEHFKELFDKAEETNDVKNTFRIAKEQLGWNTGGPPTHVCKKQTDLTNALIWTRDQIIGAS